MDVVAMESRAGSPESNFLFEILSLPLPTHVKVTAKLFKLKLSVFSTVKWT